MHSAQRHCHSDSTNSATGFRAFVRAELAACMEEMGIFAPNEVQERALSIACSGQDLLVRSQTGSGKTLMFLLPLLERLSNTPPPRAPAAVMGETATALPEALIIVPTPELVVQVSTVAQQLAAALPEPFEIGRIWGPQATTASFAGSRLIVATADQVFLRRREGSLSTAALRHVAIDEADMILCNETIDTCRDTVALEELLSEHAIPQFLLVTATLTDDNEVRLLRRFPQARLVRSTGVLVPTLRY